MAALNHPIARPRPAPTALQGWSRLAPRAGLVIERRSAEALAQIAPAWADLAARALEPNIFADPAFVRPALAHLPEGRDVELLCLWRDGRLVGAMPARTRHAPWRGRQVGVWRPPLSSLGHPLVDPDGAERTIEDLLAHLAADATSLVLPQVPVDGPFAAALARVAARTGRTVAAFDIHERAVLDARGAQRAADLDIRGRTLKELRRQGRRLADLGPVRVEQAAAPDAVAAAIDDFLALEASGWKGGRGTALAQAPGQAALMRAASAELARRDACLIGLLRLGNRPVAGTILVRSGERAWFWKVAYDEAFARYSPGVQLTLALTDALLADPRVALADSCAVPDHPMIGRLWRERMAVADLLVTLKPHAPVRAALLRRGEALARETRALAKRAYHRLQGARR